MSQVLEIAGNPTRNARIGAEPIRVALIGCGAIAAQMHLPVLSGHASLKLTALVDFNRQRAERYAKAYGIERVFDDAAALTADVVDAAVVATPPAHHAPCTIALVGKGIHVLVEKPLAMTLADAEQMVAAAEQAGVVLSTGFFRRLFPSIQLMRSLVASEWAGRPLKFYASAGGMYNWAAATLGNMQRATAGGGVLMDFGAHIVDLLFAVFDEPADVRRYCDNALGGIESDCTIDLELRHAGEPASGRIELARTRELESLIRVECERATLEFRITDRFSIRITPRDAELVEPATGESREFEMRAALRGEPTDEPWYATFSRQFDDWATAIRTGGEPILSGRSALATSRLIEACYRSPEPMPEPWVAHGVDAPRAPAVHVGGRSRRVLVTGATGFIGCRVVELLRLREQCDVRAAVHNPANAARLSRLDVEMVQADLTSADDAQRLAKDCQAVVHCAIGTSYGEPRKIANVTVGGTRRLAEAALAAGVERFVHVSSMSVYGDVRGPSAVIDETTPARPGRHDSYGRSKADAERAALRVGRAGLPVVVVRPARVFGPFSRTFIMNPLRAIVRGSFNWLGSPDVPADVVYVDNVAEALLATTFADASRVSGEAFNIGAGTTDTWRDFYAYFADQLGVPLNASEVATTPAPRSSWGEITGLTIPVRFFRAIGAVVKSAEFKSLGRRVLDTDPLGTLPRGAMERFPSLERGVRKLIGADDSLPTYVPAPPAAGPAIAMGSSGARLSNAKLRDRIGFTPSVSQAEALQLTLDWIRHARIV